MPSYLTPIVLNYSTTAAISFYNESFSFFKVIFCERNWLNALIRLSSCITLSAGPYTYVYCKLVALGLTSLILFSGTLSATFSAASSFSFRSLFCGTGLPRPVSSSFLEDAYFCKLIAFLVIMPLIFSSTYDSKSYLTRSTSLPNLFSQTREISLPLSTILLPSMASAPSIRSPSVFSI